MLVTVAVLVGYLAMLAALAIWSRKETHSLKGFYLAGKKLPYWVVAFSTNATGESGWLLLGLTGMGYAVGAQAYWVVVGEIIGIALSWGLISRRLKRLSDATDSITLVRKPPSMPAATPAPVVFSSYSKASMTGPNAAPSPDQANSTNQNINFASGIANPMPMMPINMVTTLP